MRAVLLALLLAAGGCGPGPLDPSETGGVPLSGTEGVAYLGGKPFSLSPDHRWLVHATRVSTDSLDHPDFHVRRLAAYRVHDLDGGGWRTPGVSSGAGEAVRSGGGVLFEGGCWVEVDGALRLVLRVPVRRYVGFDPARPEPEWEVLEVDPDAVRQACPEEPDPSEVDGRYGPFRIEGPASRPARAVAADDPSAVYATHRAGLTATAVLVGHIRLAPDGGRLAYTVTPAFGSFVANGRAFVVEEGSVDEGPRPLASPVLALQWSPDGGALYAVVGRGDEAAIYRWSLGGGTGLSDLTRGRAMRARVVENVTACEVDAVCYLRLRLADTTVTAVYGTGERPAPPCPISSRVSDVAFRLQPGDEVDVSLVECEGGYFIETLDPATR